MSSEFTRSESRPRESNSLFNYALQLNNIDDFSKRCCALEANISLFSFFLYEKQCTTNEKKKSLCDTCLCREIHWFSLARSISRWKKLRYTEVKQWPKLSAGNNSEILATENIRGGETLGVENVQPFKFLQTEPWRIHDPPIFPSSFIA